LQQVAGGVTTRYVLDLNHDLAQVLSEGSNTYLYGLGRIGQQNTVGWQYYHGDALGSVRQLSGIAGGITLARSYEPFGNLLNSEGKEITPYAFTGEWSEPTGLIYLRARYYDPATGRFLTKDPVRGFINHSGTLNPYTYAVNNPLRFIDPSGEFPFLLFIAGGLIGGAIYGYGSQVINNLNQGMCLDDALYTNIDWLSFWFYTGAGGIIGVGIGGAAYGGWAVWSTVSSPTIVLAEPLTRAAKSAYWNQMYSIFLRAYPRFQQFVQTGKMEIHHRIPLQWAHLFPGVDPNRLSNLYALPVNIHRQIVTPAWNAFARANPFPSAADVAKFAIEMDKIIAPYINRIFR
jgi:RHS repeat-associated protein